MKKILVVFGTRPEAIKMAPVVHELRRHCDAFETKVCVTAQHREMLDQVLSFFRITPDYDLDLMKPNQNLHDLSAAILVSFKKVLEEFKPDWVLVHGDTTTSTMAALAAYYLQIKVAHVEAGLRTYNTYAPFPEEINRQLTGRIANFHFAPTERAASNLIMHEGVASNKVLVTGNTVIDALLWGLKHIDEKRVEIIALVEKLDSTKKLIVVTGHRREKFGEKFEEFCDALLEIANNRDVQLIYPVHLNPNVKDVAYDKLKNHPSIILTAPLDYEVFIWLLNKSFFIITDSGGIQEEAPTLKKPVLVTRDVTERQEAVESGVVALVGTNKAVLIEKCKKLLSNESFYESMTAKVNPYGEGSASQEIASMLKKL